MPITTSKSGPTAAIKRVDKMGSNRKSSTEDLGQRDSQRKSFLRESIRSMEKEKVRNSLSRRTVAWEEGPESSVQGQTSPDNRSNIRTMSEATPSPERDRIALPPGIVDDSMSPRICEVGDAHNSLSTDIERPEFAILIPEILDLPSQFEEERLLRLNQFMGFVIISNALYMGIELDCSPEEAPLEDRVFWFVGESLFIAIFVVEIFIRLSWERSKWPYSYWNWLDVFVVSIAVVETWILSFFMDGKDSNLQMLTLLRIVRLMRLVRVVRLVRMFRALYVSVMAFKEAIASICYISLILVGGLYICSLFTTITIGRSESLKKIDMGGYSGAERFGTVFRSMYSLFELMTLEGWEQVGRPLVMAQPAMAIFLFGFIMCFTFGLVNMIVAMVVEKTMEQARKSEEDDQAGLFKGVEEDLEKMRDIFEMIDVNGDGMLSREEFEDAVKTNPEITQLLDSLDIPPKRALDLYGVLDVEDEGEITLSDLLEGCERIKGKPQTEWNLLSMHSTLRGVSKKIDRLEKLCTKAGGGTPMMREESTNPSELLRRAAGATSPNSHTMPPMPSFGCITDSDASSQSAAAPRPAAMPDNVPTPLSMAAALPSLPSPSMTAAVKAACIKAEGTHEAKEAGPIRWQHEEWASQIITRHEEWTRQIFKRQEEILQSMKQRLDNEFEERINFQDRLLCQLKPVSVPVLNEENDLSQKSMKF